MESSPPDFKPFDFFISHRHNATRSLATPGAIRGPRFRRPRYLASRRSAPLLTSSPVCLYFEKNRVTGYLINRTAETGNMNYSRVYIATSDT